MHKKAEDHQDKLKEMQKRHNIMVDRELNSYIALSLTDKFTRVQKNIGRQMLHHSAQHVVLILLTLC